MIPTCTQRGAFDHGAPTPWRQRAGSHGTSYPYGQRRPFPLVSRSANAPASAGDSLDTSSGWFAGTREWGSHNTPLTLTSLFHGRVQSGKPHESLSHEPVPCSRARVLSHAACNVRRRWTSLSCFLLSHLGFSRFTHPLQARPLPCSQLCIPSSNSSPSRHEAGARLATIN